MFDNTYVNVLICNKFTSNLLFKVDMEFLPDDFFHCNEEVTRMLRDHVGIEPQDLYKSHLAFKETSHGNMMNSMAFEQEKRRQNFQYGGPTYLTSFFFEVLLPGVLQEVGKAIPESIPKEEIAKRIKEDIQLGYLLTVKENQQSPHTDYEHGSIRTMLRKLENKRVEHKTFPWSFDMPQNPNGLRLAVYGTEYPQSSDEVLYETPVDVNVYGKELLLWRGDLVHGGCLKDPKGDLGALRQHGFVPLHKEHVPMSVYAGDSKSGRLGNTSRKGTHRRYDTFLNRLDGKPFSLAKT